MGAGAFESGPYRLRSASDAVWPAAYGHRESFTDKFGAAVTAVLRLIVPVLALLAAFAGLYLYRDTQVAVFWGGQSWLTGGHLLVPVGFLCVHLTNRRYGPATAFWQVTIAAALIGAVILFAGERIAPFVPLDTVPTVREALAFGGAFFFASFASIVTFDGARGCHWWTAPLFGFLAAAIFFCGIFFPAAYAGTGALWLNQGLQYLGVLAGEGVLLLLPYWMLRAVVPPLSGFGGY